MLHGLKIRGHCTYNRLRQSLNTDLKGLSNIAIQGSIRRDHHLARAAMNWSASVVSTVTSDTEPTIVIEFDTGKYIFNVGENTNRAFIQNRPNWKKTRGLFLTSIGTQRAGGLAGFLVTMADASCRKMDVIGPQGLIHFIAAMRTYAKRDYFSVKPIEVPIHPEFSGRSAPTDAVYKDENVTIYALPIIPVHLTTGWTPTTSSAALPDTALHSSSDTLKRKRESSPFMSSKHPHHDSNNASSSTPNKDNKNMTIESLKRNPNFNPRILQGGSAQEWRELLIRHIFRNTNPTPNELAALRVSTDQAAAGKGPGFGDLSTTEQGIGMFNPTPRRIISHPRGFENQLPSFSLPYRKTTNTPETKPTLAYVIVGPRFRGKFDVVKAQGLQVPAGTLRGDLTKGKAITFMVPDESGGGGMVERTVQPSDVIGPSECPSVVLVLDTPTLGHIAALALSFTESQFFAKFRSKRQEDISEYAVRVVFHQCGDGVLEDERYKAFMNGFGPDVYHVIASREHGQDPITFTSAVLNQMKLSQLDPDIFRLPKFRADEKTRLESIPGLPPNTSFMRPNARHWLRPFQSPVYEEQQDIVQSSEFVSLSDLTRKRFSEAKNAVAEFSKSGRVSKQPGCDVVITPLGTSSACPTKYRNVSSTLVQIPNGGNILLDSGEGTWGQFVRNFGMENSNAWEALRNLKCIFISHIHADHHAGLAQILSKRCCLDPPPQQPLYLVAHSSVFLYLHEYSDIEDLGLIGWSHIADNNKVKCILSDSLSPEQNNSPQTFGKAFPWQDIPNSHRLVEEMCRTLGLKSFTTVGVMHTAKCHGAIIKHTDGWSIVFSGDTVPSDPLICAGLNATLLIHEASMADDEKEMATIKQHSTFGQAVDVGREMKAKNVLLTHFSARYPKMPPSGVPTPNTRYEPSREPFLALAFDHANIAIGDMWKMNLYLPAIKQSFSDIADEADDEVAHIDLDVA